MNTNVALDLDEIFIQFTQLALNMRLGTHTKIVGNSDEQTDFIHSNLPENL